MKKSTFVVLFFVLSIFGSGAYFYWRQTKRYEIVCHYSNHAVTRKHPMDYKIDKIPGDLCTQLIYDYVELADENFTILDPELDEINFANKDVNTKPKTYPLYSDQLKDFHNLQEKWPHLKLLASIHCSSRNAKKYVEMVAADERRKTFISSVISFLVKYKLHGVDLDWESSVDDDQWQFLEAWENIPKLLKELRNEFDKHNYILSAAVYETIAFYSIQSLEKYCDQIYVKTYDFNGIFSGFADVFSPLNKKQLSNILGKMDFRNDLKLWTKGGLANHKLIVGVPFFGRSFTLANKDNHNLNARIKEAGNPGIYLNTSGILAYFEICYNIKEQHWIKEWSDVGKVPYAYHDDQWVSYENEESLAIKMQFIKDADYGGVMIWRIDMDDFTGDCGDKNSLLAAINNNLN